MGAAAFCASTRAAASSWNASGAETAATGAVGAAAFTIAGVGCSLGFFLSDGVWGLTLSGEMV